MNPVLLIQENKVLLNIYRKITKVIKIIPYYTMRERLVDDIICNIKPSIDNLDLIFFDASDMKEISNNPEVFETEEELLTLLNIGCLCLGLKINGKIAAYTWCDLKELQYKGRHVQLKDNEAFLFDARTFVAYRGKNLAPYLRYQLYKKLTEKGKNIFISHTTLSNTASMKFKKKLGGRPIELYLYIGLLGTIHFHIHLKHINK